MEGPASLAVKRPLRASGTCQDLQAIQVALLRHGLVEAVGYLGQAVLSSSFRSHSPGCDAASWQQLACDQADL